MFKLTPIKSINWPVTVSVPQDGGTTKKYKFTVQFDLISHQEYKDFFKDAKDGEPGGEGDIGIARRVVTGWQNDLCDESGNPLEYNEENKERLINTSYARGAIITSYIDCSQGKAAEKN